MMQLTDEDICKVIQSLPIPDVLNLAQVPAKEVLIAARAIIAAHEQKLAEQCEPVAEVKWAAGIENSILSIEANEFLPLGTKLYTHPQQDARDAERYRKIMSEGNEFWLRLYNTRPDLREAAVDAAIQRGKEG